MATAATSYLVLHYAKPLRVQKSLAKSRRTTLTLSLPRLNSALTSFTFERRSRRAPSGKSTQSLFTGALLTFTSLKNFAQYRTLQRSFSVRTKRDGTTLGVARCRKRYRCRKDFERGVGAFIEVCIDRRRRRLEGPRGENVLRTRGVLRVHNGIQQPHA